MSTFDRGLVGIIGALFAAACGSGGGGGDQGAMAPPSGKLDATYGIGGSTHTSNVASFMATNPDGSVYAIGRQFFSLDSRGTLIGQPTSIYPEAVLTPPVVDSVGNVFVIAGSCCEQQWVAEYDSSGNLVTSFGDAGRASLSPLQGLFAFVDLARDGDGNLYVTTSRFAQPGMGIMIVAKLDRTGHLVPSFGTAGISTIDLGGASANATVIAVDSVGNIYVGGLLSDTFKPVVAKLDPAGRPSLGFNGRGFWSDGSCNSYLGARAVAVDDAGNVFVGTRCDQTAVIYKLDPRGNGLASFGDAGKRTDVLGGDSGPVLAIAPRPNGVIYVAGSKRTDEMECGDFAITKLDASGGTITSFGTNGLTLLDFSAMYYTTDIGFDAQGRIYVGGPSFDCHALRLTPYLGFTVYRLGG